MADPFAGVASPVKQDDPWAGVASPVDNAPPKTGITDWTGANIAGAAKGASLGFGDEMMAGIRSPFAYVGSQIAGTDKPLNQIYDEQLAKGREQEQNIQQRNPFAFGAGQVEGALLDAYLTGGSGLNKAVGSGLKDGLLPNATSMVGRGANALSKVGVGATTGAISSGIAGLGDGQGVDGRLQSAQDNAVTGAALGGALPAGSALLKGVGGELGAATRGLFAQAPTEWQAVGQSIKDKASGLYTQMRNAGADIAQPGLAKISTAIDTGLAGIGKMNARLHGDTLSVLDDFKKAAANGTISLEEMDQFRQLLKGVVKNNTTKIDGANTDAAAAQAVIDSLDDAVETLGHGDITNPNAVQTLNDARSAWGRYKRFDRVQRIIEDADGNVNKIRTGLAKFAGNKLNLAGASPEEINAIKGAASPGGTAKFLRGLGTFGFDIGANKNFALPGLAAMGSAAVPGGIPVAVAGTVARQVGKAATKGRADDALRAIAQIPTSSARRALQTVGDSLPDAAGAVATVPSISDLMNMPPAQARAYLNSTVGRK